MGTNQLAVPPKYTAKPHLSALFNLHRNLSKLYHLFLKNINLFIYFNLVLAALGLCCCTRAFSSCYEWGLLFVAVCSLLIAVTSLVAEHGL